jgi:glycosyltransferase involved in cell wall biosynthesis
MKIAFITYTYPNNSLGGSSNYAFNLTKSISKYEDVSVFVPKINEGYLSNVETKAVHNTVDTINAPFLRSFIFMYNVSQKINKSNFDVIHSHGGAGAFIKTNKPFIETFHHWPKELLPVVHGIPMRFCLKKADRIIAVSEKSKEEITSIFREKENKICVIENGIDDIFFKEIKNNLKEEVKQNLNITDEKIILHINTELTPRKNLPLMLDTIRYIKDNDVDIKLVIIAPESGEKKVLFQAKQKRVFDEIIYVHMKIPREKMPYYYSIADFLAMPSTQEGFGIPLVEALAMNKSFVSLNTGVAPELEERGFGYVSISGNDFKKKCLNMLRNPIKFTNGKSFVKKNYSWDESAKKVIDIYKSIQR